MFVRLVIKIHTGMEWSTKKAWEIQKRREHSVIRSSGEVGGAHTKCDDAARPVVELSYITPDFLPFVRSEDGGLKICAITTGTPLCISPTTRNRPQTLESKSCRPNTLNFPPVRPLMPRSEPQFAL